MRTIYISDHEVKNGDYKGMWKNAFFFFKGEKFAKLGNNYEIPLMIKSCRNSLGVLNRYGLDKFDEAITSPTKFPFEADMQAEVKYITKKEADQLLAGTR